MGRPRRTPDPELAGAGWTSGPGAPVRATALALERLEDAVAAVLVEGVSDQAAVETTAALLGMDLVRERVVVVPIGGAHAAGRFLTMLGPAGAHLHLAGLYDVGEQEAFRRGLAAASPGTPVTAGDLEPRGFFACDRDLEDELVRAVGVASVETVLREHGDLDAFRTLQRQPAWRSGDPTAQLRRFLGARAGRKLRYAQLLTQAAARRDALPRPLIGVLAAVIPAPSPGDA